MTVVLVHGNPATSSVWDYFVPQLNTKDVIRLSPPGFGVPAPPGFGGTVLDHRDWLIGQLEQIGGSIDLIGQDWGAAHVLNVAMARPDLIRSWVSDAVGLFHPDYQWHSHALIWQTPTEGETWMRTAFADGASDLISKMIAQRCDPTLTRKMAQEFVDGMPEAILKLYRSASQPTMSDSGKRLELAASRPGLVLIATDDHVQGGVEERAECARRAGADVAILTGREHWWMTEVDQHDGVDAVNAFLLRVARSAA